jgi:hypothetical protein
MAGGETKPADEQGVEMSPRERRGEHIVGPDERHDVALRTRQFACGCQGFGWGLESGSIFSLFDDIEDAADGAELLRRQAAN